jgi:hypothetical protein
MSEYRPQPFSGELTRAPERVAGSNRVLFGLALVTLCACEAIAGEGQGAVRQSDDPRVAAAIKPPLGHLFGPPYTADAYAPIAGHNASTMGIYPLPELTEAPYSPKDFRPRGRSVFETDTRGPTEENLAFDTTIWQRLNEYRNRDRIRVLTLWESGASVVSLQTDRRWGPSLQWTSRLMNRGGATHGLLDRLFPVSLFTASSSHGASPHSSSPAPAKVPSALTSPHISAVP